MNLELLLQLLDPLPSVVQVGHGGVPLAHHAAEVTSHLLQGSDLLPQRFHLPFDNAKGNQNRASMSFLDQILNQRPKLVNC